MESGAIKMVVLASLFACFALVPRARSERGALRRGVPAQIRERNNVVKCEGLRPVRSKQIRVEIDLITSASCRDAVFTSVSSPSASRGTIRPCSERKTGLRIHASANRSLDYNVRVSTPRHGGEDAWFHLPIANRNRNPAQNRNDRYILRRSGRIEPAAYSSPARFKIVPMHPILFRPLGVAQSAFPTANSAR